MHQRDVYLPYRGWQHFYHSLHASVYPTLQRAEGDNVSITHYTPLSTPLYRGLRVATFLALTTRLCLPHFTILHVFCLKCSDLPFLRYLWTKSDRPPLPFWSGMWSPLKYHHQKGRSPVRIIITPNFMPITCISAKISVSRH